MSHTCTRENNVFIANTRKIECRLLHAATTARSDTYHEIPESAPEMSVCLYVTQMFVLSVQVMPKMSHETTEADTRRKIHRRERRCGNERTEAGIEAMH